MKSNNNISTIIPLYNAGKYLEEAIKSVLSQQRPPEEIIIVDDGSTDNSLEIARKFGDAIRVICQEHLGAGAARNSGVKASRGNYIAFLDADDLWLPQKLKTQMDYLEAHPETDMVFGNVHQFISPELGPEHQRRIKKELERMAGYVAGSMLIKKQKFTEAGFFNENLELGEFIDWFSRAKDLGLTFHLMDEVLLRRRIHISNMGITKKQHLNDYTAILREALARKRKANG